YVFLAMTFFLFYASVGFFGLESSLIRYVGSAYDEEKVEKISEYALSAVAIVTFSSVMIICVHYFVISDLLLYFSVSEVVVDVLAIYILSLIPYSLCVVFCSILRCVNKASLAVLLDSVLIPFISTFVLYFVFDLNGSDDVNLIGYINLFSSVVAFLIPLFFIFPYVSCRKFSKLYVSRLVKAGFPMLAAGLVVFFTSLAPMFFLERSFGGEEVA
ncbi:MATE family efflux transporter, partial [Gilvimarinus sp. SDUM040013]|uniref:MATE family efflux transporter n=1 Tax=Gilvimarinus gilvus TaxID=3058038 RepID=UPI00267180D4